MTERAEHIYVTLTSERLASFPDQPSDLVAALRPLAKAASRFLVVAEGPSLDDWKSALAKETPGYRACFKHTNAGHLRECAPDTWDTVLVDARAEMFPETAATAVASLRPKRAVLLFSEHSARDIGSAMSVLKKALPEEPADAEQLDANGRRNRLQDEAVEILMRDMRLILNWGTGTGKSRVAVRSAQILHRNGKDRLLLLVGEEKHKGNWLKEFRKCLGEEEGKNIYDALVVECYASLPKYRNTEWDLIVADEAHHLRSDKRTEILSTMKTKRFLCLSATMSEKGDAAHLLHTLRNTFGPFAERTFTLQDSIDAGILHEPQIYVHVLPLAKVTERQTVTVDWGAKSKRVEMSCTAEDVRAMLADKDGHPAIKANVDCTAAEGYKLLGDIMSSLRQEKSDIDQLALGAWGNELVGLGRRKKALDLRIRLYGGRRKALLGTAKSRFAEGLIGKVREQGLKYVCFCTDCAQGERLGAETVIHSGKSSKANDRAIDDFNEGRTRSLYAIGMIREGQNLAGIQAGVIVQLGGKERDFIQKFGRAMRAERPVQHVVVFSGTKDEDFYNTAVENISPAYINELRYGGAEALGAWSGEAPPATPFARGWSGGASPHLDTIDNQ